MDSFFHGIELVEINDGIRPISTVKTSIIGIVGTAPDADPVKFPLNTPVLIVGRLDIVGLGETGTLTPAVRAIHSHAAPWIVVIRVDEGVDDAATRANVVGGVDVGTGQYQGVQALLASRDTLRVTPRILIAPGFTTDKTVVDAMLTMAERLKAVVIADGPNTTDPGALAYRGEFDSARLYLVDPWCKVQTATGEVLEPCSPRVAGIIAASDNERGFWWSPSNRPMLGISGMGRAVSWAFNDPDTRANYLNSNDVATVIHQDGYRLWGNRTTATDKRWAFLSVRRTADMINESLMVNHLWAVDRNITKTYIEDVTEGVNAYLRRLKALGAILGGRCYADPELNTPASIADGRVYFDFDFTAPYPAERITFRSHMVNDYLEEILR